MSLDETIDPEIAEGLAFCAKAPKLMQILDAVSAVYLISKIDLMSERRHAPTVTARDAFYWLALRLTLRSHADIGRFLANRDHTTVWDGERRVRNQMRTHRERLRKVCQRLGVTIEELSA